MLRITNTVTPLRSVWTLCGQLAGPWVSELRSSWEQARPNFQGKQCLVDLSDVTFIDESGEQLLRDMRGAGVEFHAAGVDTKDVIEHLEAAERRPLRMCMAHMADRCSSSEDGRSRPSDME